MSNRIKMSRKKSNSNDQAFQKSKKRIFIKEKYMQIRGIYFQEKVSVLTKANFGRARIHF